MNKYSLNTLYKYAIHIVDNKLLIVENEILISQLTTVTLFMKTRLLSG